MRLFLPAITFLSILPISLLLIFPGRRVSFLLLLVSLVFFSIRLTAAQDIRKTTYLYPTIAAYLVNEALFKTIQLIDRPLFVLDCPYLLTMQGFAAASPAYFERHREKVAELVKDGTIGRVVLVDMFPEHFRFPSHDLMSQFETAVIASAEDAGVRVRLLELLRLKRKIF